MAYGYATGNYNPQIQSIGNQASAMTRRGTDPRQYQQQQQRSGQVQQFTSPANSAVTPTGQISQNFQMAPPPAGQPGTAGQQPSTYYSWGGSPVMTGIQGAILGALANPLWGSEQVAQLKGAQKDSTALMTKQLQQQLGQNTASRGTFGSGAQQAGERRIDQGMASDLLSRYRDIDLQTTEANRADLFRTLGMGMDFTQLDEGLGQAAVQTALGNKDLDIRKLLGMEGIAATREGNRMGLAGNLIGSLLGYQSGLDRLGFDYTALDANQQNALLDRLLRGF